MSFFALTRSTDVCMALLIGNWVRFSTVFGALRHNCLQEIETAFEIAGDGT